MTWRVEFEKKILVGRGSSLRIAYAFMDLGSTLTKWSAEFEKKLLSRRESLFKVQYCIVRVLTAVSYGSEIPKHSISAQLILSDQVRAARILPVVLRH